MNLNKVLVFYASNKLSTINTFLSLTHDKTSHMAHCKFEYYIVWSHHQHRQTCAEYYLLYRNILRGRNKNSDIGSVTLPTFWLVRFIMIIDVFVHIYSKLLSHISFDEPDTDRGPMSSLPFICNHWLSGELGSEGSWRLDPGDEDYAGDWLSS